MKAKLSLLFISKFKSDTNTLLFNKIECYKKKGIKSYSHSVRDFIWSLRRWISFWRVPQPQLGPGLQFSTDKRVFEASCVRRVSSLEHWSSSYFCTRCLVGSSSSTLFFSFASFSSWSWIQACALAIATWALAMISSIAFETTSDWWRSSVKPW